MHLIVYISKYFGALSDVDKVLADITSKSEITNERLQITGMLFFHDGYFVQLIEGERQNIELLMSKIEKDSRHYDIRRIVDEAIDERSFHNWRMDSFKLDEFSKVDLSNLDEMLAVYRRNYKMDSANLVLFFKMALDSNLV